MRHDRVVYIGTFSNVLFPALRLGYLVVPPSLWQRFAEAREAFDLRTPDALPARPRGVPPRGALRPPHPPDARGVPGSPKRAAQRDWTSIARDHLTVHNADAGLHVSMLLSTAGPRRYRRPPDGRPRPQGDGAFRLLHGDRPRNGLLLGFGGSTERCLARCDSGAGRGAAPVGRGVESRAPDGRTRETT